MDNRYYFEKPTTEKELNVPFSFYLLNKSNNLGIFIYRLIIILFGCIGIFFSGSRASYIFGGLIVLLSFITSCFLNKNKKTIITVLIFMMISLFPIPGGAGGAAYSFSVLFASFIHSNTKLVLAMILWRVLTYYFGMFAGIVAVFIKPDKVKR